MGLFPWLLKHPVIAFENVFIVHCYGFNILWMFIEKRIVYTRDENIFTQIFSDHFVNKQSSKSYHF